MRPEESCIRVALCALVLGAVGCTDEPLVEQTGSSGQWHPLVEADWQLGAGEEGYTCARATITEDIYIDAFRALSPLGTHHTVLSVDRSSSGTAPDGTFECDAATNGQNMLFGSGVGTLPVEFPEGVAIKIEKGSSLVLNLHLFNVSTDALNDRSGIEVRRVAAQDVVHEAEIVLAGKVSGLIVPPGESTQTGECAMSHDVTLFAVFPHMHQLGAHLKATAEPAGGSPTVLVDAPYSFDDQVYYDVDPQESGRRDDHLRRQLARGNVLRRPVPLSAGRRRPGVLVGHGDSHDPGPSLCRARRDGQREGRRQDLQRRRRRVRRSGAALLGRLRGRRLRELLHADLPERRRLRQRRRVSRPVGHQGLHSERMRRDARRLNHGACSSVAAIAKWSDG
jgi:hypothetical protein